MATMMLPHIIKELIADARTPAIGWEILVLALAFLAGAAVWRYLKTSDRMHLTRDQMAMVVPAVSTAIAWAGWGILALSDSSVPLLQLATNLMLAWVGSRFVARLLLRMFPDSGAVHLIASILRWIMWGAAVLASFDLLKPLTDYLDHVMVRVGTYRMSVESLIEGSLSIVVTMMLALWLSAWLEAKLMRSSWMDVNLRVVFGKLMRGLFLFIGILVSLSVAGIDLTVLSVFGGALGVGLGLGLQKIAANYVSGFVVLLEHSVQVGDYVQVGTVQGRVTAIYTRYTVIQSVTGVQSIIPNEMLISGQVNNMTALNNQFSSSIVASCGYDNDVDKALEIMKNAALHHPRVLKDPAPYVAISAFAADAIELTLGFYIADPEKGTVTLKGALFREILQEFNSNGIDIPYPQRVLRGVESDPVVLSRRREKPSRHAASGEFADGKGETDAAAA